jgi:hypothetical protein
VQESSYAGGRGQQAEGKEACTVAFKLFQLDSYFRHAALGLSLLA